MWVPKEAGDTLGTPGMATPDMGAREEENLRAAAPRNRAGSGGGLLDQDNEVMGAEQRPPSSWSSPRDLKAQDTGVTAGPPREGTPHLCRAGDGCTDLAGAEHPSPLEPLGGHPGEPPPPPPAKQAQGYERTRGHHGHHCGGSGGHCALRFRGQRRCHECRQLCPPPPPEGPPDTAPATCWDKLGWGTGMGAGCSQAGQQDEGMRGAAGSREIRVPGVRKGKEGDRSEPGWTQACGEEFRIAASLHLASPGRSRAVWPWNLSRHRGMRQGDAGGHRVAGGDPQPGAG